MFNLSKKLPLPILLILLLTYCGESTTDSPSEIRVPAEIAEKCFPLKLSFKGVYVLPDSGITVNIERSAFLDADRLIVDSTGNDELSLLDDSTALLLRGTLIKIDTIGNLKKSYRFTYETIFPAENDSCRFIGSFRIDLDESGTCGLSEGIWDIKCGRYDRGGGGLSKL